MLKNKSLLLALDVFFFVYFGARALNGDTSDTDPIRFAFWLGCSGMFAALALSTFSSIMVKYFDGGKL